METKVLALFDQIPSFLSKHEKRVILSDIEKQSTFEQFHEFTGVYDYVYWLERVEPLGFPRAQCIKILILLQSESL